VKKEEFEGANIVASTNIARDLDSLEDLIDCYQPCALTFLQAVLCMCNCFIEVYFRQSCYYKSFSSVYFCFVGLHRFTSNFSFSAFLLL